MGLQSHQFNRIGKSEWRTQFDYVGLQYQTQYQYTRRSRSYCQTQKMELSLQGKSLVFTKNELFRAEYNVQFLSNEICSLKKEPSQKALFEL